MINNNANHDSEQKEEPDPESIENSACMSQKQSEPRLTLSDIARKWEK